MARVLNDDIASILKQRQNKGSASPVHVEKSHYSERVVLGIFSLLAGIAMAFPVVVPSAITGIVIATGGLVLLLITAFCLSRSSLNDSKWLWLLFAVALGASAVFAVGLLATEWAFLAHALAEVSEVVAGLITTFHANAYLSFFLSFALPVVEESFHFIVLNIVFAGIVLFFALILCVKNKNLSCKKSNKTKKSESYHELSSSKSNFDEKQTDDSAFDEKYTDDSGSDEKEIVRKGKCST